MSESRKKWARSEVKRRIAHARDTEATALELSYLELTKVPRAVYSLKKLEYLGLRGNEIRSVSPLSRLKQLNRLDLRNNPIQKVPDRPGLILDAPFYLENRLRVAPGNVAGLHAAPREISWGVLEQLPNLRVLDLSPRTGADTRVKRFRWPDFEQLPNLEHLEVFYAGVTNLPVSIHSLHNLKSLQVGGNFLGVLPHWIAEFSKLEFLGATDVGLSVLPDWIPQLRSLNSLYADYNSLTSIPAWIGELVGLRHLSLGHNLLTGLPREIGNLKELNSIRVSANPLREFPREILALSKLEYLFLDHGSDRVTYHRNDAAVRGCRKAAVEFQEMPKEIVRLNELRYLGLRGQPITTPPEEIWLQGIAAVQDYFRQREEAGTDYLCEAKLLIVGEGGAGKTTLAKKILDPGYELDEGEDSTEGISVMRWSFPTTLRVNDGRDRPIERNYRVNMWDFGGQEIYHATHQFFLTRRSLYALVADSRREDTDFHYWLNAVELLSDGSPLLIVNNEKQDRKRDLDEVELRRRFPSLVGVLGTNLETNRNLPELLERLRHELEGLPLTGTPLPASWKEIREKLEQDPRDYITQDEYLDLCEGHGFTREEDKLQLSGYLHDLGVCLHFQEDPVLRNTVILKPDWGTNAVYRVLDNPKVVEQRGRFSERDLAKIWHEPKYKKMRKALLQLMRKFQLCYRIENTKTYIAPQLLSRTRPDYPWQTEGNVHLRYRYEFMPKGIITRLIVALHASIADQSWVWKTGAVFEQERTRAEVIEDYPRREIRARFAGPYNRELLAIVHHELGRIHRSFATLKYETLVPCDCPVCAEAEQPHFFPHDVLRRFGADKETIQCPKSYDMVDAGRLMGRLFGDRRPTPIDALDIVAPAPPEPSEVANRPEVFVSYAWGGDSEALVDTMVEQLRDRLSERHITLIRDKNELTYRQSVKEFMERLGRGGCVVVVLSKRYLESPNCMFELTEIAKHKKLLERVFPVVMPDAGIFDPKTCLRYIRHWESEIKELDAAMKGVEQSNLEGIREEIDLYRHIRATIAELMEVIGNMNTLTSEAHEEAGFEELYSAILARVLD